LLCVLLSSLGLAREDGTPDAEQRFFEANVRLFESITKARPGARFVTLGRSGTPLEALAEAMAPDVLSGIPLSLRDDAGDPIAYPPTREVRDRIYRQLDRFLPSAEATNGSEIVLVDYFDTGGTLLLAHRVVRDYLAARGRREVVSVHGFGGGSEAFLQYAKEAGVPATATELGDELADAFLDGRWKDASAYPTFRPEREEPTTELTPSKRFVELVRDYRERYQRLQEGKDAPTGTRRRRQPPVLAPARAGAACDVLLRQL
jgi:hypothetical protein